LPDLTPVGLPLMRGTWRAAMPGPGASRRIGQGQTIFRTRLGAASSAVKCYHRNYVVKQDCR
jgi:hypothetical protein